MVSHALAVRTQSAMATTVVRLIFAPLTTHVTLMPFAPIWTSALVSPVSPATDSPVLITTSAKARTTVMPMPLVITLMAVTSASAMLVSGKKRFL